MAAGADLAVRGRTRLREEVRTYRVHRERQQLKETFRIYTGNRHDSRDDDQEVIVESLENSREKMEVEGEERGDAVLQRVLLQRGRHRKRSIFVRAGIVIAGGAASVVAAPLLLAPELGLPLLLFGLRLLALEFDWAARLYARVEKFARRVLSWLKSKVGIAVVFGIAVVVAVAVWTLVY